MQAGGLSTARLAFRFLNRNPDQTDYGCGCVSGSDTAFMLSRSRPLSSASSTFTRTACPSLRWSATAVHTLVCDLRDVQQAVLPRQHAHDRAEVEQLEHGAVVDPADFDVGRDVLDAFLRDHRRLRTRRRRS